ncbi:MAG: hypothetical protein IID38_05745, partial [Planctomycetes bacterium]|nr:hypothetical protein [Planctomycetota bacterium]
LAQFRVQENWVRLKPFAATLGIMLYPGEDDPDRRKARAFAAHYLAEPIRRLHEAGGTLSYKSLVRIATDGGERLDDLEKRWWRGTATGELFKTFFALAKMNETLATWSNAIKIAKHIATRDKVSGARSALWRDRSRFISVAHLWGAWCIREGRFSPRPDIGYDGYADFQSFLTEAEILRQWGQSWRHLRDKAKPPLPAEVWRVPEDWRPPIRQPGWPATGMIPDLTLPEELLATLKPAGRPRKPA